MNLNFKDAKRVTPKKEKPVASPELKLLPSALIVKDVQDRNKLGEGRSFQLGFGFCKRMENGEFHTVNAISPCKDYLNDVVYTEQTGKAFSACGLNTKVNNIFKDVEHAFLAMKVMPEKGGNCNWGYSDTKMEADRKNLRENYKNVEYFINYIEDELKVGKHTIIRQSANDPDMFLLSVPLWWCRTTHLISMYSLFVRGAQFYKGIQDKSPLKYLEEFNEPSDKHNWRRAFEKYQYFKENGPVIVEPSELTGAGSIHGSGICSLKLPTKALVLDGGKAEVVKLIIGDEDDDDDDEEDFDDDYDDDDDIF